MFAVNLIIERDEEVLPMHHLLWPGQVRPRVRVTEPMSPSLDLSVANFHTLKKHHAPLSLFFF